MIHVVAIQCLLVLPLLIRIEIFEGVGVAVVVGVLKFEESESESERLCTDSTALHKASTSP
jgi:hypothetical protein